MLETDRLLICDAEESDIGTIMALEQDPENRRFVWQGTREQHLSEITNPDDLLWLFRRKTDNAPIGFALSRIDRRSNVFELRRIALSEKGSGYGREALTAIMAHAFENLSINRFWLDVYPHNSRGIHLYESLGMVRDGVLRQNYLSEQGYLDQIVYSLLKEEYVQKADQYR